MFLFFCLNLGLLFFGPAVNAKVYDQKLSSQVEAGFNLTETGLKKVLASQNFGKVKSRTDSYFEIYDGTSFLLLPRPERVKMRLKSSDKESVFQIKSIQESKPSICGNGLEFATVTRTVGEAAVNGQDLQYLQNTASSQLEAITDFKPETAEALAKFHRYLSALNVPLLDQVLRIPDRQRWVFSPAYVSQKRKQKVEVQFGNDQVKISVTESSDYVGRMLIQRKGEIEFELNDNQDEAALSAFEKGVCDFVKKAGLTSADVSPQGADPRQETLSRLKKYNQALGL